MKRMLFAFRAFVIGAMAVYLCACGTCKSKIAYRDDLTDDPKFKEANESYKKATRLLDKAGCEHVPAETKEIYRNADSYLSDAVYKLEQTGYEEEIDVSDEIYYAEEIKREIGVRIGQAEKETTLGP